MATEATRIRDAYAERQGLGYWSARNPRVQYQRHVIEAAVLRALTAADVDLADADILDVGTGSGEYAAYLALLGANRRRV